MYIKIDLIKNQVVINYSYESKADLRLNIEGDGAVARTLRKLVGDSDKSQTESRDSYSNKEKCLPHISNPNVDQILAAVIKILSLFILILVEVYLKRFNRIVCAFFHQKWERKRAMWLYVEILKRRKFFLQNAKNKIFLKIKNGSRGVERSSLATLSVLEQK